MKTLLVAINAKYAHTNLAVRTLHNALEQAGIPSDFAEYTINQPVRDILSDIALRKADRILFSCYIWNRAYVCALGEQLRLLFPRALLALGGPEVSFEAEEQLASLPWADAIFCGEGETLLPLVLREKNAHGVYYAEGCVDLDALPFPYADLPALSHRVVYYESSRGCPYGCSYCLSSADTHVRYRSLEKVFDDLHRFLDARVMKVKFVDRTFNLQPHRALAIWRYLMEHDNGVTAFQMELGGDLTTPEQLTLLKGARPGLLQFEIGVQSTCADTLQHFVRATDLDKLRLNVQAVRQAGGIHQHLDLIAGLPGETMKTFAQSYNDVLAMRPQQLQLGFLKLLRGSRLYARREALGLIFSPQPPYEILQTPSMSFSDLITLKAAEQATELYYNSGRFSNQLEELLAGVSDPFSLMMRLGQALQGVKLSQYDAYDHLYEFAMHEGRDPERMAWLMRLDLCLHEPPRRLPKHCASEAPMELRKRMIRTAHEKDRYVDLFPASILGCGHEEWIAVSFDYAARDDSGQARISAL